MQFVIGKSVTVHMGNVKDENSNRNQIVFTLFRLIQSQTADDCVDDFKINMNYDSEMRGQDKKNQKYKDGFEI